jgi:predicted nucleic acid-binding protein
LHARDQAHTRAKGLWRKLQAADRPPITTSLVIAETHGLIARRVGVPAGLGFLDAFAGGRGRHVVWVDENLARDATERWLRRYRDQPFSLTDATSFEVMRREGLREAFTFDQDFERAGFGRFR